MGELALAHTASTVGSLREHPNSVKWAGVADETYVLRRAPIDATYNPTDW